MTNKNNSNKLPTLTIQFSQSLKACDLQSFRSAIIERAMQLQPQFEAAGLSTDLWHQHKQADTEKLHYRYPLIQYQLKQGKASITAIGDGVAALKLWLQHNNQPINWGNRKVQLSLLGYPTAQNAEISITEQQNQYRLYKWVALNQTQFEAYVKASTLIDKIKILQQCLQNHLVALSFTLLPNNKKEIKSVLTDFTNRSLVNVYGNNLLAFDVVFSTNLKLPNFIGLGKAVSIGFGKQQPLGLYQTDSQKINELVQNAQI